MFLVLGVGAGAVYASIALGLVLAWRASRVVNFAHGAMAMYATYVFVELRSAGDLVLPVVGVPARVHLASTVPFPVAFALALVMAAALGLAVYVLVFRPLRAAGALARVVASVGLMVALQAVITLDVGSTSRSIGAILPARPVTVLGLSVPRDRLLLAAAVAVAAAGLSAVSSRTRFGLASRAAADDETTVALLGWSPDLLAAAAWIVGSVLAGAGGILVAPITGLNPVTYSLLVVPALAAALVGRLSSFWVAAGAAIGLGMAQAEIADVQSRFRWLPHVGFEQGLPLVVILVLAGAGRGPAVRAARWVARRELPRVGRPRRPWGWAAITFLVAGAGAVGLSSAYRLALITSMVAAVVCLSLVVLVGYVGQISLAQMAFAGVAGFALARLTQQWPVPFPLAPAIAASGAGAVGLMLGVPALRARGLTLAVVTLAGAVAVEELMFNNTAITGGVRGRAVKSPVLFGLHLGIDAGGRHSYPSVRFALLVAVVLALAAGAVAALPGRRIGRRLVAVRSDESAARVIGIDTGRAKLTAFVTSAALAGVAGTLMGYQQGRLSPASFGVFVSLGLLALAYLGGIASTGGALLGGTLAAGGLAWTWLDRAAGLGRYQLLASAVGVIAAVVLFPDGVAGAVATGMKKRAAVLATRLGHPLAGGAGPGDHGAPVRVAPEEWPPLLRPVTPSALAVGGVRLEFGRVRALDDVSLSARPGEVVGLIGPNGAGKTTLLDVIAGVLAPDAGAVRIGAADVTAEPPEARARLGVGRTFQTLQLFEDLTVAENVLVAAESAGGPSDPRGRASQALAVTGLDGLERHMPDQLNTGLRRRLALARAVAGAPGIVVLDEPAAGLDAEERAWLARTIRRMAVDAGAAVVLVDHDTGLVFEVSDSVVVLDLGRVVACGEPEVVRRDPAVVAAYLGSRPAAGPTSRPRRVEASGVLLRTHRAGIGWSEGAVVHDLDLEVREGELVGLFGPNGAGKTTTLMGICGVATRWTGVIDVFGEAAASPDRLARRGLAHVPEGRGVLAELTVDENLRLAGPAVPPDRRRRLRRDLVERFPVLGELGPRRAGLLSGGEQQILAMARALLGDPKLMLIDELSLGLAPKVAADLLDHLRVLAETSGLGVLLVEQHTDVALTAVDRVYVMARGRIVDEAAAEELVSDPERLRGAYL